ncbi:MAG: hypothetical protein ABII64_03270 [Elusimicrobiota bacterium]
MFTIVGIFCKYKKFNNLVLVCAALVATLAYFQGIKDGINKEISNGQARIEYSDLSQKIDKLILETIPITDDLIELAQTDYKNKHYFRALEEINIIIRSLKNVQWQHYYFRAIIYNRIYDLLQYAYFPFSKDILDANIEDAYSQAITDYSKSKDLFSGNDDKFLVQIECELYSLKAEEYIRKHDKSKINSDEYNTLVKELNQFSGTQYQSYYLNHIKRLVNHHNNPIKLTK